MRALMYMRVRACIHVCAQAYGHVRIECVPKHAAVRQEHHALELEPYQTPAIKSIVGFLQGALENRQMSGIRFRVYDVLYALDCLSKCHDRKLIGIDCGLVCVCLFCWHVRV